MNVVLGANVIASLALIVDLGIIPGSPHPSAALVLAAIKYIVLFSPPTMRVYDYENFCN